MNLPYSEELHIESLARLFDNTSECYKFFWFKAIVSKVCEGKSDLIYEELVDEMIADAWYMVTEYHLNLGPSDTLEKVVNYIKTTYPSIKSCEKKSNILSFLKDTSDKEIIRNKKILIGNVPYRLQAPFMAGFKGKAWDVGFADLISKINKQEHLMYYFEMFSGLDTKIHVQEDWIKYIVKNQEIIRGWLEFNMIHYLQRRNPSVPGIADKLYPPGERNLEKIKKYWKLILSLEPVYDVYSDELLSTKDISIDHFIPWSYVAHDEMWNLTPTTRSINSSKSNSLPDWNKYFDKLARQEYQSYQLLWKYDSVHKEFEKCAKDHINNDEVRYRIYKEGLSFSEFATAIENVVSPVYKAARDCGFANWAYKDEVV